MKRGVNLLVVALLVAVGVLLWTIGRVRRAPAAPTVVTILVPTPSSPTASPAANPAAVPVAVAVPVPSPTVAAVAPAVPVASADPTPVSASPADGSTYVARPGDTVADLAAALPGGAKKINREAVIAANPSLQQNPDRVLAGSAYTIPAADAVPGLASKVQTESQQAAAPAAAVPDDTTHQLKYSARPGDTVSTLAGALLGSDSKANRDAIVAANSSLQSDPDHLVADKTYHIPVRAGQSLAAAPEVETPTARPTTQPDADAVVQAGSGRELRYVAQPGDTVATLATALLGSDTKQNASAIIDSNASLRANPDHVIAGKTYWIPAPTAAQPD